MLLWARLNFNTKVRAINIWKFKIPDYLSDPGCGHCCLQSVSVWSVVLSQPCSFSYQIVSRQAIENQIASLHVCQESVNFSKGILLLLVT